MIAEIALAIEAGMTAEDIALTIHAHPTLGDDNGSCRGNYGESHSCCESIIVKYLVILHLFTYTW